MPDIVDLGRAFRAALERRNSVAVGRIVKAYSAIITSLGDKIDALMLEAEATELTVMKARELNRYIALVEQASTELMKFSGYLQVELNGIVAGEVSIAGKDVAKMFGSIDAVFNKLPADVIETMLGYLDPSGPLVKQLNMLAPNVVDRVSVAFLDGVALGRNPKTIAKQMYNAFGIGLADAMRITRTTQLYAYREATRVNYLANDDVVSGWYWMSALKPNKTCMSCVNQHGSFHTHDEKLNDHYNGFCTMLPAIKGRENPLPSGQNWFDAQTEVTQKKMLGNKYELWRVGKIKINQLSVDRPDEIFGDMKTEPSLKQINAT